jgi:hypothetical protein
MTEFQKRLVANIRESLRFAVGEVDDEAVAHMVAGVNAVLSHPSAPATEKPKWGEMQAEDCVLSIGSSRVCAHGTHGCVNHHAPAPADLSMVRVMVEISPAAMELFTDLRAFFQMMAGKAVTPFEQQFADHIRARFADLRAAPDSPSLVQREGRA